VLEDAVYGRVEFEYSGQDDPIILKSNGWPTYHLAAMVDDHDTGITHVIRGEDWLSSAPKHVYLFEAMEWTPPIFAHVPLIIGIDKKKLSKRHGSTTFVEFIEQGYLPEALFNFLVLLGWSPGEAEREIFSREEIVSRFSLAGISTHPAVFDYDKLRWMNGEYIRATPVDRLAELCVPFLQKAGLVSDPPNEVERQGVARVIPLLTERMKLLSDVAPMTEFFFRDPVEPDEKGRRKWLVGDRAEDILNQAVRWIGIARDELTEEGAELATDNIATTLGIERGPVIHTLRLAVTGRTVGPGLFETLAALGKQTILKRLKHAKSWIVAEA
jgi:glutamyl-tRNA synthetase